MLNHPPKLILVLCLFFSIGLVIASPFQVLEETPEYIKVKFVLPEWKLEDITKYNQNWQQLVCDGASAYSQEGYPKMLSFAEAIGIPVDGDISFQITNQKKTTITNANICPSERMVLDGMEVSYTFAQDTKLYRSNDLYPSSLIEKGNPAFAGNRRMIPMQIFPFQYKGSSKQLVVTTEAEIIINISGNKTPSRDWASSSNSIDLAGNSLFLNNRTSQVWRKSKDKADYRPTPRTKDLTVNELQLIIDQEGIYKITYQYLTEKMALMADSLSISYAWNTGNVDPRFLQLNDENGSVAMNFVGEEDGSFDQNDYFEFFGDRHAGDTGYEDDYTSENVYTLKLIDTFGSRLAVENAGLVESDSDHYIVPDAYQHTIHLGDQLIPDKLGRSWLLNQSFTREDLWFWRKITAPNLDIIPFELQYPKESTIRTFSTTVSLYGLTYSESLPFGQFDHSAAVRLNQSLIDTHQWRDQTEHIFQNPIPLPNSFLHHGTNYYYISLGGDTAMGDREQVLVDYIDMTYWREYKTDEDFIAFKKPSNRPFGLYQFEVQGFSGSDVSLYKIGTSVFNNMQIEPFTLNGSAPWTVTFQDSVISNDVRYYACTQNMKKTPKVFRVNVPSYWNTADNSAECLIITNHDFSENEGTLLYKSLWESQGYSVAIIDVQDIYDEYNNGIKSCESIKEFLTYAYNNWAEPQLQSVLLLGDGTDDERDNSASRKYNIIPVKKIWTYKHGATASDDWYGCVVGNDPISDISISRIGVWKPEQILPVAQKSQHYLENPNFNDLWHGHVTLTSGGKIDDATDTFAQQSETIRRRVIPSHYRASRVYTSTQTVSSDFFGGTFALKDRIDQGTVFLQFMGHGGGRIWADYNLFNFNDVATLNNDNYPVVSSLACYASAFDTNGASCLSEALILAENKGAIATIGFSGLGYLDQDLEFGLALSEALFQHDFATLGEAVNYTKAKYYISVASLGPQQALTYGCAVLGDAMIRVLKPQSVLTVNTNRDNFEIGDTLRVNVTFPPNVGAARTYVMKKSEVSVNVPYDLPVIQNNYNYSYVLNGTANETYQRKVYVGGSSNQAEYVGFTEISVGRGLLRHDATIPAVPSWNDPINFRAKVSLPDPDQIGSLVCKVRVDSIYMAENDVWVGVWADDIPMVVSQTDTTVYVTSIPLPAYNTGKELFYKYRAVTDTNQTIESILYSMVVAGPELYMSDLLFTTEEQNLAVKALVQNIGTSASANTDIKLYATIGTTPHLLQNMVFSPLGMGEERWVTLPIDTLFTNNVTLEARVNIPAVFPEWSMYDNNNKLSIVLPLNYHEVSNSGAEILSLDSNLKCTVPANMVPPGQISVFYVNALPAVVPKDQPDVKPLVLRSGVQSIPYEVRTLDPTIADSTGVFNGGKRLKLTYFYSTSDTLTQQYESDNSFKIYRWESTFKKWVLQGGNISVTGDSVIFEVNRQGVYTLLRNKDHTRPSIDVNVQDQEFTVGGYISSKGIISLVLNDANGIDVFDHSIKLFIGAQEIPEGQWVQTTNSDAINRIPIKYQLNLQKGNYTLIVQCKDVNGNFHSRDIQFIVNDQFDVIRLANYPNPIVSGSKAQDPKNAGRTRFTYVLTDDAEDVTIKVFTVSGRLVKTFRNLPTGVGYHEFPRTVYSWDCTDEQGFFLANGTYFYRIIAKKGNKTIEKIQKMAIVK